MRDYLNNLLPRLRMYSQTLDRKELLVDQPWVLVDDNGNKQQYIFERDGQLIMSLNGQVQYGKWKYIPAAKSLVIDRPTDSILLNHDFVSEGVCILKRDGFIDHPWMLVNERIVPDLDLQKYLFTLLPETRNFQPLPVDGGVMFYDQRQYAHRGHLTGVRVINYEGGPINTTVKALNGDVFYVIEDNVVVQVYIYTVFDTDRGRIKVEHEARSIIQKGNKVWDENGIQANGKFKISKYDVKSIEVKNGVIAKTGIWKEFALVYGMIGVVVFGLCFILIRYTKH